MAQGFGNQRLGMNISAGAGLAQTGTVVFSNANALSYGMQLSASSYVMTMSLGAVKSLVVGAITLAAGTIGISGTLGLSIAGSGNTINVAKTKLKYWETPRGEHDATLLFQTTNAFGSVQRISIPYALTVTQIDVIRALTVSGSGSNTYNFNWGLYGFSGSTATLLAYANLNVSFASGSATSSSSIYGGHSGTRFRSVANGAVGGGNGALVSQDSTGGFTSGSWNITPGEYMLAFGGAFGLTNSATISLFGRSNISNVGAIGGGNDQRYFGDGIVDFAVLFDNSFHLTNVTQTGSLALGQPYVRMLGIQSGS